MYDIFITVHDQDLILRLEKNKVFREIKNYKYLFLGNRPVDKLGKFKHKVIVSRNLPDNIENYKSLLDYTGWYAVSKNNLAKNRYVCFLQYDYLVHETFEKELLASIKNHSNSMIAIWPAFFDFDNEEFSGSIQRVCKDVYNMDIKSIIQNRMCNDSSLLFPYGNSFCCDMHILNKYINWMEPLLENILNNKNTGHSVERSIGCFCVANNIPIYTMPYCVKHIFACAHDQKYSGCATQDLIEMFLDGKMNKKHSMFDIDKETDKSHTIVKIFGIKMKFKRRKVKI